MAYTNMSGTSDTDLSGSLKQGSGALGPDATTDALGEPEVVEVVEIETYEPTPAGAGPLDEALAAANQLGFQWWMVPAVALPVAAGATAVVLLLRRRQAQQQSVPVSTYTRLAKQSRDWMDAMRSGQATKAATKALQQGIESVRTTATGLPDTASAWRGGAGDLLAALAASAPAQTATGGAKGALDAVTGLWNTNAKQTATQQRLNAAAAAAAARASILGLIARGQAQDAASAAGKSAKAQAKQVAAKANKAADKAKPVVAATAATASVKAAKAARQTNRMAKRAGKRANNAAKRTRAFTFGMLVAATATYWRAWRQRLLDKETRETAGGRLVKA